MAIIPILIMHYPILPGWTEDGFTVGWNRDSAPSDKQFVAKWYPKKVALVPLGDRILGSVALEVSDQSSGE